MQVRQGYVTVLNIFGPPQLEQRKVTQAMRARRGFARAVGPHDSVDVTLSELDDDF